MRNSAKRRGNQSEYNRILDAFNGKNKTAKECIGYLISQGFSYHQAKNAVHVYRKGGKTNADFILPGERRTQLLDEFNATKKAHKECVNYLRSIGCTYHQANTACYIYRQEKGLIGK
ncbi:hypothetical protein ES704_02733 [subsurface metagenome]|jgi:hypothetical protein